MPDIKIKRYADKENLKKLMKYSKDTFANKNEINDKFYTKEQIDTMLGSGSGGTGGGGGTGGDYYTKSEIDTKLNSKANTSDLSTVATSGDYNDLINKPNISQLNPQIVFESWPDGPEAHNAMWGGRDITTAFDAGTVSANIANGTFRDIFPGDYITKSVTISDTAYTVNWVIADCDYWINKGDEATTDHHVVIVPQTPIFNARMNPTSTTEGGYVGSWMYGETILQDCTTGIVNAFGSDHILTFRDYLTQGLNTSAVSSGITTFTGTPGWNGDWFSQRCNLMSEAMVYNGPHCASSAMDNIMATRQMSAFRLSEKAINYNRQWWWLRDVVSSKLFASVGDYGGSFLVEPNEAHLAYLGVRPFALLV